MKEVYYLINQIQNEKIFKKRWVLSIQLRRKLSDLYTDGKISDNVYRYFIRKHAEARRYD